MCAIVLRMSTAFPADYLDVSVKRWNREGRLKPERTTGRSRWGRKHLVAKSFGNCRCRGRACLRQTADRVCFFCCSGAVIRGWRSQFSTVRAGHPQPLARIIHRYTRSNEALHQEPNAGIRIADLRGRGANTPPTRQAHLHRSSIAYRSGAMPRGGSQTGSISVSDSFDLAARLTRSNASAGASATADDMSATPL